MKCKKYELNKDKISEFYNTLINLDDWIPFIIEINHPTLYYDHMQNVEDKSSLSRKQNNHVVIRDEYQWNHKYIEETDDWEIELFLNNYPQFKPLFKVNEEFKYGSYKNKHQKKSNSISRTLRKIFAI